MIRTTKGLVVALMLASIGGTAGAAPSFDCSKVEAGSIEALICQDDQLSAPSFCGGNEEGFQRTSAGAQGGAARLDQGAQ
jgi:hypothetical protein